MPKRSSAYISDDFVVSDEENGSSLPRVSTKPSKKVKASSAITSSKAQLKDDNGDLYFELNASGTRRVTINSFKGKTLVNVREYYEKDGKMLPGKKGISLVMDQFSALVQALPQIESVLEGKGESVPRPAYGESGTGADDVDSESAEQMDLEDEDQGTKKKRGKAGATSKQVHTKPNYEDTSDEDAASD
ncbi:hypothetical protein FH972_023106 [Carpinus fangiana]|uniref:Transcriptional coactivator p15 (PC4) C-terminal domain-containing protein n=1 Tax=Carpinus fangiana TaxID=176857 RepID=A0A5N6KUI9_9ROSI|nr:hypothetical protein FH972_023106 [Carpinus fangiana]